MNIKQSFVIAIACLAVAITASDLPSFHHHEAGFLNFMSRSNDLLQRNPTRSLECFNYYLPILLQLGKDYENNYQACLDASAGGRAIAEADTQEQRDDLAARAEASCAVLSQCVASSSVEKEFDCYIDGGAENAKTMYGINADASDELAELLEQYRLIDNRENRCTNETKRDYEVKSAEAYSGLNDCILGISGVPTEGPVTDEPITDEPITDEPITDEPVTDEPITDEPITDEPITDEPITEEPITEEPITEEPITEEPITEEPITEEPITEEPITEEPITEEPITEEPITEEPITEEPITEEPITEEPITEEPITEEPITEEPITEEPITEEPITEEPITEEPITEEPITEEPTTEDPNGGDGFLPEEDIDILRAVKQLKYRLQHRKV